MTHTSRARHTVRIMRPLHGLGAVAAAVMLVLGVAVPSSAREAAVPESEVRLPPLAAGECGGDVPIVVASDLAAQSDLYSAVTLAGVIGTDCIVLAGGRDHPMPADQRARLDAAPDGGYVVGGTAAVPDAKLAGRDMTRLAGTDRWHTARLVGIEARRAAGGTPEGQGNTDQQDPSAQPPVISLPAIMSCELDDDGAALCTTRTQDDTLLRVETPEGPFSELASRDHVACGLRVDGTVACWRAEHVQSEDGFQARSPTIATPSGTFTSLRMDDRRACGLRPDNALACWPIPTGSG